MSYSSASTPSPTVMHSQMAQDYSFQYVSQLDAYKIPPGGHALRDPPKRHRPPPFSPVGASPPSLIAPYSTTKVPLLESTPRLGWYVYFEVTDWKSIIAHFVAVGCAYPFLILICLLASNKTLFWSRVIVGFGCGILAFTLGRTPFCAARRYLEASTWATFIHESTFGSRDGLPISILSERMADATSTVAILKLLYRRNFTTSVTERKRFDKTPWSLVAAFSLFLVAFSSSLTFVFGRIVDITTFTAQNLDKYDEVPIFGDLTNEDMKNANNVMEVMEAFIYTWTLAPFASLANLPKPVSFPEGNDTTYFAETYTSQLQTSGSGIGTFDIVPGTALNQSDNVWQATTAAQNISSGIVQFPKWGLRISCASIPNIERFLVPFSSIQSSTYVFVPKDLVQQLFGNLNRQMPEIPPVNLTSRLNGDVVNIDVDPDEIITIAKFSNNGVAHSLFSNTLDNGDDGNGWATIEVVLIRINDSFTPFGTFPLYGDPILNSTGSPTRIGYDAAVCVEVYEPWIVETFNSTGLTPSSRRIVRSGNGLPAPSASDPGGIALTRLDGLDRTISSTGKSAAFDVAHENSVNQMVKDNGRDFPFVPSPMMLSFTSGVGPNGYTELSPSLYATARASADATNVLPFLAGSKQIVGRRYEDFILANASVNTTFAIAALGVILVVGVVSASCVPRLPFDVPRRGFDLLSWLSVLYGDHLSSDVTGPASSPKPGQAKPS